MRVKACWYLPQFPDDIVVELPSGQSNNSIGELKVFSRVPLRPVSLGEMLEYNAGHPANSSDAELVPDSVLEQYGLAIAEEQRRIPVQGAWRSIHSVGLLYLKLTDGEFYSVRASTTCPIIDLDALRHIRNFEFGGPGNFVAVEPYEYSYYNLQLAKAE